MPSSWEILDICGVENCRTRKYKRDTDGYLYCKNGHRHDAPLAMGEDDWFQSSQGQKVRKRKEEKEIIHQHLSGHKAFELYLHSYQLVLRKQVYWLVSIQGFPADLEAVVRELWALRLQQMHSRVDEDITDSETQSRMYSSQSETEAATSNDDVERSRFTRTRGRELSGAPRLIDSISLCYLATVLIQVPVSLGDFLRWINAGKIIYYSAIREIPHQMLDRLPGEYHQSLQPTVMLKPDDLYNSVTAVAIAYDREYGLSFPPINYPILLFHFIRKLALPLEVYAEVRRLASIVSYRFRLPSNDSQIILHSKDYPEAQLMSLVIVAVKIIYPFEQVDRHPSAADGPAAAAINWAEWEKSAREYKAELSEVERLDYKQCLEVTEDVSFGMSDQQLDDYLSWYEGNFASERISGRDKDFRRTLYEMFPAGKSDSNTSHGFTGKDDDAVEEATVERINKVQRSLQWRRTGPDADESRRLWRPGNDYRMFCKVEELDGYAKVFYEECADLVGMSESRLVRAVHYTEKKLASWVEEEMKKARN